MTTQPDLSNDSQWYEYLQNDLFWVLAILICLNGAWTYEQHELLTKKDEGQEDTQSSTAPQKPASGIYLKDHITSRLRQYLTIFLCTLPLPIQLIHGLYVLKTIWRVSLWLVKSTYPASIRPRLLSIIIFSPIALPMLFAYLAIVAGEALIVATQLGLCVEVSKLEPNARPDLPLAREEEV